MARRRNYRRSNRRRRNTTWQCEDHVTFEHTLGDDWQNLLFKTTVPGIDSEDGTDPFDHAVTLERVRGSIVHDLDGVANDANRYMPFYFGAFIVPAEVGKQLTVEDLPDLRRNSEGEDFPIFYSHICAPTSEAPPIFHEIDVKAKRRLEVGSRVVLCGTIRNTHEGVTPNPKLNVAFNLRYLWAVAE